MSGLRHRWRRRVAAALLVLTVPAGGSGAEPMVVGNGLTLACSQPEPTKLRCNYRLTGGGEPLAASASVAGVALAPPAFAARSGPPDDIAVLLLVDTSDPARATAVHKVREHIDRLLAGADARHRFGLAAFDSEFAVLAPIGSDADAIRAAAANLEAKGRTTELYRSVVEAIRRLATLRDEHKVLVVMSDGLAEDRAYFHDDAVRAALKNRITVYGIGYPRSVSLSVGLQSLRRLAEETGGRFVATDTDFELPAGYFDAPFAAVDSGGALTVDLGAAAGAFPAGGSPDVRIALETSAGPVDALVPVSLPPRPPAEPVVRVVEVEVPKVVEVEKVVQLPARPAPAAAAAPPAASEVPLWYWVAAVGVLALALALLLVVLLLQRRSPAPPRSAAPALASPAGNAHLIRIGEGGAGKHPIGVATFRIGRLSDNDLVLDDPSVSRHHAEVRRRRDGGFLAVDLDSMNGMFVNGEKVSESPLADGDLLELGDVGLTFTVEDPAADTGERTVMLRTVLPDHPFSGTGTGRH